MRLQGQPDESPPLVVADAYRVRERLLGVYDERLLREERELDLVVMRQRLD